MLRHRLLHSTLLFTSFTALGCGDGASDSADTGGSTDGPTTTTGGATMGDATMSGATMSDASVSADGTSGDGTTAAGDDDTTTAGEGDATTTAEEGSSTAAEAGSSTAAEDGSSSDGSSSDDGSSTGNGNECTPTEPVEATCDGIDNDCDGYVDDVDAGNDGICDCLAIGIIGETGFAPTSNFEAWLESQGTTVTRTIILGMPGIVDDAFLAQYDILIVDRIQRELSPAEADAIEAFVKEDGRGLVTLIGYNFDNSNPVPERDRANTVLAPFGLAYEGGYIHDLGGVTPTFDQTHPISMGIFDVNFAGGIVPADQDNQGTSTIFATVPQGDAGLAHETMTGGRVVVWGDEWITFDSDWLGYADVQAFWSQILSWARPQDFCGSPV